MCGDINLKDVAKLKEAFSSLRIGDTSPEIKYIFFARETNDYGQPVLLFVEDLDFDPHSENMDSIKQSLKLNSRIGKILKDILNTEEWEPLTINCEKFNEGMLGEENLSYIVLYRSL